MREQDLLLLLSILTNYKRKLAKENATDPIEVEQVDRAQAVVQDELAKF
jgi:hypothetical protein